MDDKTPSWGIDPVPDRLRVLGLFDTMLLWANLSVSLLVIVLGAVLGPIGFVRRYVRKFAVWAVAASMIYLTWWVLDKSNLHQSWHARGQGGLGLGAGIDIVIGSIVSWTPLAADYTRFSRDRRSAFFGTGIGYFVPTLWCFGLGALLVLERGLSEPAQIPTAVASGSALAIVALLMLTVDESDEAFADIYSTAVSIQNVAPWASQRLLIVLVGAAATGGAIAIDLGNYLTFLYLLGSVFVPLFAVLLVDWLTRGAHYEPEDVFSAPTARWELLLCWFAGFALYQWLSPVGPHWWTTVVNNLHPGHASWTASLPSFA